MPLNSSLQVVRFCIYRLYANTKAEFRGLQIFSKMQSPQSLSLAVLLGGYLSRISHLCNLSNHIVHIDSLSAGQSAPPTAIVLLDNDLALSFQSFRQPAIDQPPLHDLTCKRIDILCWQQVLIQHFIHDCGLIRQYAVLNQSPCGHNRCC